ncbi:MAG: pentapeptide repeat-containing protein [Chloroflexota bacterium]
MTLDQKLQESADARRSFLDIIQQASNWTVLWVLIIFTLSTSIGSAVINNTGADVEWWSGWLQNFSTEMMGAIATFFLFELIIEARKRREDQLSQLNKEKADIIIQMRSKDNATALSAIERLRSNNWLQDGSLINANLEGANLQGANLSGANLKGVRLDGANLEGADLSDANLERANLNKANLKKAKLFKANLSRTKSEFVQMVGANLVNANLEGAYLNGCFLQSARLSSAKLEKAYLSYALLQGAELTMTNLKGASLAFANLEGTNLEEANLEGVDFTKANLKKAAMWKAQFDTKTILPDAGLDTDELGRNIIKESYWTSETDWVKYGAVVKRLPRLTI